MTGKLLNNKGVAQIVIIIGTILALASIPLTIFLVKQRQEIRKQAAGLNNKITCLVTGNRYDSTSIQIINNTSSSSFHNVYKRFCNLNRDVPNPLASPYTCDAWEDPEAGNSSITVPAGQSQTVTIGLPNCKVAQLDITNCECVYLDRCSADPNSGESWVGGMAYVLKQNRTGYDPTTGSCPVTVTPSPSPTPSRTPTPSPSGGVTPTITGTRTPTPTGPTLIPTRTPTLPPTATVAQPTAPPAATNPPVVYPSATPVPPVTGNVSTTIFAILGGGALLLIGLIL